MDFIRDAILEGLHHGLGLTEPTPLPRPRKIKPKKSAAKHAAPAIGALVVIRSHTNPVRHRAYVDGKEVERVSHKALVDFIRAAGHVPCKPRD